jgi:hypothetical protein
MTKLTSIRIIAVGMKDYRYLFEDAIGLPATSLSNDYISLMAKAQLGEGKSMVQESAVNTYPILWLQPPLTFPYGREWWLKMRKFQPNALIIFLEPDIDLNFYQAALQEYYNKILDVLDLDEKKADKLAEKLKILFLFVLDNSVDEGLKAKDYLFELHKIRMIYQHKFKAAAFREVMLNMKNPIKAELTDLLEMVRQVFEDE